MRVKEAPGEPNSETHLSVIEVRGARALLHLSPVTGRKHQLRVHLAALGIPIVNDTFYPDLQSFKTDDMSQPLQLLARAIAFKDPISGLRRHFESTRKL